MIYASLSGGVTTVRHRRGHLGTVEPTPSQERRRIDGVVDGVTRTRGRCFVMASMMLCLDVFSSLSINLSIASKLAMHTSHSFGSALALAASPVASSASASNIRRSIVLGVMSGRRLAEWRRVGGESLFFCSKCLGDAQLHKRCHSVSQRQEGICACRVATTSLLLG